MALTVALGLLLVRPLLLPPDLARSVDYPTFKRELVDGNVMAVTFDGRDVRGTFRAPVDVRDRENGVTPVLEFTAKLPEGGDPELPTILYESGAQITGRPGHSSASAGWPALPVLASLTLVVLIIVLLEGRLRGPRH